MPVMEDTLVLGLPNDGKATVAPANAFRLSEGTPRGRAKYGVLPALLVGAVGAELAGSDDLDQDLQRFTKPYDDETVGSNPPTDHSVQRIEDVAAFLREMANEIAAQDGGTGVARVTSVRLRYGASEFYSSSAHMERLLRAFNDNGQVSWNEDSFRFPIRPLNGFGNHAFSNSWKGTPTPRPLDRSDSGPDDGWFPQPGGHDPRPRPGDDDEDDRLNRLPTTSGRSTLPNTMMNLSTLIFLGDLLRLVHDADGDTLSIYNLRASSGDVEAYGPGRWLYTPDRGALGEVTFTYHVSDGYGVITVQATMSIVKPPPREFSGTDGDDRLIGTPFEDIIDGRGGDDFIYGRESDDIVFGGWGDDSLIGGDGNDLLHGDAGRDIIFGGRGNDVLFGGDGNDDLYGEAGNDTLMGGVGNDRLMGGEGNDRLFGDDGDDVLLGESGNDLLEGGTGDDDLSGGGGNDVVLAGAGDDVLRMAFAGEEQRQASLAPTDGDDVYSGGQGTDNLDTSAAKAAVAIDLKAGTATGETIGSDQVESIENVVGTGYDDTITGDDSDNAIHAGGGDDVLTGGKGDDTLRAEDGDDTIVVSTASDDCDDDGDDVYSGGEGTDTLDASAAKASIQVDLKAGTATGETIGSDQVEAIENVVGTAHDDTITGDDGDNAIHAGAGDDVLTGGNGDDTICTEDGDDTIVVSTASDDCDDDGGDVYFGGEGTDTLDASAANASVEVDLKARTATGETIGSDQVEEIENVVGSGYDDTIIGDDSDNAIHAGGGDDLLMGAGGDDTIRAEDGDDVVLVVVSSAGDDGDDVYDGGDGVDTLDLTALVEAVVADFEARHIEGSEIGRDTIIDFEIVRGGRGNDQLSGDEASDILHGGAGNDRLKGRDGDDILVGGDGQDEVQGNGGNDTFLVFARTDGGAVSDGNDSFDGGDGVDIYDTSATRLGVMIDLYAGHVIGTEIGADLLTSVEGAIGGSGDDTIVDGFGVTIMTGGAGNDIFVFGLGSAGGDHRDEIRDFAAGDRVDISSLGNLVFDGLGVDGEDIAGGARAGRITFYHQQFEDGEQTVVRAIIDLERDEDIEILLQGRYHLTEQDFLLAALEQASHDNGSA
ncbi:cadherin-like domain-containing protein [Neorhizobium sp. T786]|uniref:cadherin-like domain-containing protein n=1 Tax=Pseudorhizobium xiangyangii TaxID=2883104 RepID=UPI001CFF70D1|nr:cadherin-like domain-containing protein [Neorhizobium xiangyangii]MCB5204572.1 cadherin-like domain-containing protein [Neorhizobium xiangyangii]